MNTEHILKLERECADQRLKDSLRTAREETRNDTLNACINVQVAMMNYNMMAMWCSVLNTDRKSS